MSTPLSPRLNLTAKQWVVTSLALLLGASSCQKEEITLSPNAPEQTSASRFKEPRPVRNGKLLKFDTRQDFEFTIREIGKVPPGLTLDQHLEKWEKDHNFKSLRASKASKKAAEASNGTASRGVAGAVQPVLPSTTTSHTLVAEEEVFTPSIYTTPSSEQEFIEDEYLATLLSPDYTVQIGNLIYRLDGESNYIYYMAADNGVLYDELISQQPNSPDIYWYQLDQNVLDLQDAGIDGTPSTEARSITVGSGIGCGSNAPAQKDERGVQYSRDQRLDCKLVYQSAGIYFSLIAKAESQNRFARIWWAQTSGVTVEPLPAVSWRPQCGTWSSNRTTYYNYQNPITNESTRSKVSVRYYESTRGLNQYDATVRTFDQSGRVAGPTLRIAHY